MEVFTHSLLFPQRNTFQLVIASQKTASYAILLYAENGVQFVSTPVEGENTYMHTGFSKGSVRGFLFSSQGPYYRVTTEDQKSIASLAR